MGKRIDLKGMKFGRLTVISYSHTNKGKMACWRCACECGKEVVVSGSDLRTEKTKSCGCLNSERSSLRFKKHGKSKTRIYMIWCSMLKRCNNESDKGYKNYGGRGIKVCKRWLKFENFFADMGEKPSGKSLDRIDNDGDYCPENCRWATRKQQARNTRAVALFEMDGKRKSIAEWAELYGISSLRIWYRVNKLGWDLKKALTT